MANWASTCYYIEGQQCDLREIFNLCKDFMDCKRQPMKETAYNEWEGNVIMALGMDVEKYYLRGFIQACELDGDVLRIDAEEAWSLTDFKNALESHYDGLKVYFFVEEPGMEVFATNDAEGCYFTERYWVDCCVGGEFYSEYFTTKKQAMAYVAKVLGKETVTEKEIEQWNDEHEIYADDYIYVHEFDIVD